MPAIRPSDIIINATVCLLPPALRGMPPSDACLEGLGARRVDVGQGPDVTWVVFADPEGNEFCLLRRTVQELMAGQA
jgi:hypothetical protein